MLDNVLKPNRDQEYCTAKLDYDCSTISTSSSISAVTDILEHYFIITCFT